MVVKQKQLEGRGFGGFAPEEEEACVLWVWLASWKRVLPLQIWGSLLKG